MMDARKSCRARRGERSMSKRTAKTNIPRPNPNATKKYAAVASPSSVGVRLSISSNTV